MRFQHQEVFRNVSMVINPRDRIGLVGRNGAGKTTLLRIIAGLQAPSAGRVVRPDGFVAGYLPQQMKPADRHTLREEARGAFTEIMELEKEMARLQSRMEEPGSSDKDPALLDRYSDAMQRHRLLGGHSVEAELEQTLLGLGFLRSDFDRHTSEFSGGWRMRIELARILLSKPAVLLLDEPTNHLDIESIVWMEKYLSAFEGALVLISHDRKFLDTVTGRTVEISMGKLYDYRVPFTKFRELRTERRKQQLAAYRNQQKKIEDTGRFVERFRYKATKAAQVQSRIKQLEKMDRIEIELEDFRTFNLKFPPAPRSGTIVAETRGLTKRYGDRCVLEGIDMVIERGEKVAFAGRNGEGKTTLSRILAGELDCEGEVRTGHNVSIGYFAQNQDEIMDGNKTVFATLDDVAAGDIRPQVRSILGAFLFHGDDIDKKVKVLSGGERSRLALAQLLLRPYNLLILDEPTNHLDMRSKDILKHALLQYDGTLIVVSHDREFLDGLADKVYEFGNRRVREHRGGIFGFLQRKGMEEPEETGENRRSGEIRPADREFAGRQEYRKRKELERRRRSLAGKVARTEANISKLEAGINALHELMRDPEKAADSSVFERYEKLKKQLNDEMWNWEKYQSELEQTEEGRK